MKILIASDIHGSAYYCEELLCALRRENSPRLLLLGDLLYHGPRNDLPRGYDPKAVLSMLNSLETAPLCVRGNCESEVDQMVLNFPALAEYALLLLGDFTVLAQHGHHMEGPLPALSRGGISLSGHTHIPKNELRDGIYMLNPGSVSIPKEQSPNSYMLWEDGIFLWKTLSGEIYDRLCLAPAN